MDKNIFKYEINKDMDGLRLDKALSKLVKDLSRSRIQKLIEEKNVLVDNLNTKWASYKVREGMKIKVIVPLEKDLELESEDLNIKVIYEDDDIIVIDKDAGIVVHPAPGNYTGTLVNGLLFHCGDSLKGIGGVKRPGIVHRIDKDTSGVMVVAKSDKAHKKLVEMFAAHDLKREYIAFVYSSPPLNCGVVDKYIVRSPYDRKKMAISNDLKGKRAITNYYVIKKTNAISMISCVLETGRTHQIRVHMASIGCPLVGDKKYGKLTKSVKLKMKNDEKELVMNFKRQALHARKLEFKHPISGEKMSFVSELPFDMKCLEDFFDMS